MDTENKVVIDLGGKYRFAPEFKTTELPGGIYYPDMDGSGNFILVETSGSEDMLEEETDPFVRNEGGDPIAVKADEQSKYDVKPDIPLDEEPIVRPPDNDEGSSSENLQMDTDVGWVHNGYFPLEKYNPELEDADERIESFLDSKDHYRENDIDYRRSILFYGEPGTGKSQYVMHKCRELVSRLGAVVVRLENARHIDVFNNGGVHEFSNNMQNRLKVIVFEELSDVIKDEQIRQSVVNVLDSSQLRESVLFLATTNRPEELPKNLVDRPGRLDYLEGIYPEDNDPEYVPEFYEHLMGEPYPVEDEDWTEMVSEELTPAYVKGLFINAYENNETLKKTYERIEERRELVDNNFDRSGIGF